MPTYVYGCKDKDHSTVEMIHGMFDVIDMRCTTCGQAMHRVPQRTRFYTNPADVLFNKLVRGDFSRKAHKRIEDGI